MEFDELRRGFNQTKITKDNMLFKEINEYNEKLMNVRLDFEDEELKFR
jgi:hypothetical protein